MSDYSNVEGVDMRRLPHEITRALDAEGILVDTLTPGLNTRFEGDDVVVVSNEGQDLARFPAYRLGAVDKTLLAGVVNEAYSAESHDDRGQIAMTGTEHGGGFELIDNPAADEVEVQVGDWSVLIARWRVVPDWPEPGDVT